MRIDPEHSLVSLWRESTLVNVGSFLIILDLLCFGKFDVSAFDFDFKMIDATFYVKVAFYALILSLTISSVYFAFRSVLALPFVPFVAILFYTRVDAGLRKQVLKSKRYRFFHVLNLASRFAIRDEFYRYSENYIVERSVVLFYCVILHIFIECRAPGPTLFVMQITREVRDILGARYPFMELGLASMSYLVLLAIAVRFVADHVWRRVLLGGESGNSELASDHVE